jgi:hypothetical protein
MILIEAREDSIFSPFSAHRCEHVKKLRQKKEITIHYEICFIATMGKMMK